jgi:hypothetical protein
MPLREMNNAETVNEIFNKQQNLYKIRIRRFESYLDHKACTSVPRGTDGKMTLPRRSAMSNVFETSDYYPY